MHASGSQSRTIISKIWREISDDCHDSTRTAFRLSICTTSTLSFGTGSFPQTMLKAARLCKGVCCRVVVGADSLRIPLLPLPRDSAGVVE